MIRKRSKKTLFLQQELQESMELFKDHIILIGSHHKKYQMKKLFENNGNISAIKIGRLLMKIDNTGWTFWKRLFGKTIFVLKQDIKEVFLNRYIVIKNGPVYDLKDEYFLSHDKFYRFKKLYEKGLVNDNFDKKFIKLAGISDYKLEYRYRKNINQYINKLRIEIKNELNNQ